MITSDGREEVVQHLLTLGFADFVVKPLRAELLIEKLGRLRSRPGRGDGVMKLLRRECAKR